MYFKVLFIMKITISFQFPQNLRQQLMLNLVKWVSPLYVFLFKRGKKTWQENRQSLLARKKDSFGFAIGSFLQKNEIELMPHLESHDVYHVVSGYPATVQGEAELIFFILGNGKKSFFTLGSAALAVILMPEWWEIYRKAFKRGKKCNYFVYEDFEKCLDMPFETIKKQIFPFGE